MNEYNEIDRLLSDLVHFVAKNPFDFSIYDTYAKSIATAFDREFLNTSEAGRKMTITRLKDDVNLSVYIIVRKPVMSEESTLKERHRQIMNLFRNHVKSDIENGCSDINNEGSSYKLIDWFREEFKDQYSLVMEALVTADYLYPGSYLWKDKAKGSKGAAASILKMIYGEGYLEKEPLNEDIVKLAKNAFGVEMSKKTAQRAPAEIRKSGIIWPK